MRTGYLAAEGYETDLADELAHLGVTLGARHGRLLLSESAPVAAAWAANIWFDVETLVVSSIADAAAQLRARQRNWAHYAPELGGRTRLIAERLPYVAAKPLALGAAAPGAPLGSWTLLTADVVLASGHCSSPFPNGEIRLAEDRDGPPSRAYLKLAEAFVRIGRWPVPGERCLDLGASPGGWAWLLAERGAEVTAVDKAPLDPAVAGRAGVRWRGESAFGLDPLSVPPVDWWCADIACYPERLLGLVQRWLDSGRVGTFVFTIKFQGPVDHALVGRFAALPGARLFHLHHNKHELTCVVPGA